MTTPSYYQRLIRGTPGMLPAMLRLALWLLTWPYRVTLAARNAWYDRQGTARELSVPVISVGNITTGGTGKTPTVIDITTRLIAMDKKPGIVARGYGAEPGLPNDEELLIRRHLADKYDVAYVADPNRYAAARFAIDNDRADCIVMDDGFQHRKLHRDLNIVLIDATCPFGHGHLLPRGLLREPLSSLRRADLVMLTRSDQVSTDDLERTEQRIRAVNGNTPIIHTTHRVTGLLHLDGTDADMPPQGARVALFAAIANPEAFVATAQSL
ncbi:MAG: tetraacyldisaccharide 4'-kinase, partial [Planctomycetota bacterium]